MLINIIKKIINILDTSIIIFNKNQTYYYSNPFFNKTEKERLENKHLFNEIFPEYNKQEIQDKINYIFENNTHSTCIEKNHILELVSLTNEYFMCIIISNNFEQTKRIFHIINRSLRIQLTTISSKLNMLLNTNINQEQIEYISQIQESLFTLISNITNILDFFKLKNNDLILNLSTFNFEDCINTCINIIQDKADKKNIKIFKIFHNNVNKYVIGDNARIKQLLVNLLDNAIEFTEKGYIKIEVYQDMTLNISISDSGIGITTKEIENIFDIKNSNGFGLVISKFLVEMMNGNICVQSKVGKGTTIIIKLPLQSPVINEVII